MQHNNFKISKKIIAVVSISALFFGGFVQSVFAQETAEASSKNDSTPTSKDTNESKDGKDIKDNRDSKSKKTKGDFCANLDEMNSKLMKQFTDKKLEVADTKNTKKQELKDSRLKEKQQINDKREEAISNAQMVAARLKDQATTDEQKTATDTFLVNIKKLYQIRKDAIDKAIKEYQVAYDALVTSNKKELTTVISKGSDLAKVALDKAKASCKSGTASEDVKKTFIDDLQNAKDDFGKLKDSYKPLSEKAKTLIDDRDKKIKAAQDAFKSAADAEKEKLKTYFK